MVPAVRIYNLASYAFLNATQLFIMAAEGSFPSRTLSLNLFSLLSKRHTSAEYERLAFQPLCLDDHDPLESQC